MYQQLQHKNLIHYLPLFHMYNGLMKTIDKLQSMGHFLAKQKKPKNVEENV